jgi:hypothetical protein
MRSGSLEDLGIYRTSIQAIFLEAPFYFASGQSATRGSYVTNSVTNENFMSFHAVFKLFHICVCDRFEEYAHFLSLIIALYSPTSIIRTNWSSVVFGLSNRPDNWISNKQFEFFSKIIYSKDLMVYFIYKQPTICKILYLFNVAINHVTGFINQRGRSINTLNQGSESESESESELLYDWRYTANRFVLAISPLRLTTE